MLRVNVPLDPTKTGREAESLESNLRKMIVGQDEAIEQIVNIYQMHEAITFLRGRIERLESNRASPTTSAKLLRCISLVIRLSVHRSGLCSVDPDRSRSRLGGRFRILKWKIAIRPLAIGF